MRGVVYVVGCGVVAGQQNEPCVGQRLAGRAAVPVLVQQRFEDGVGDLVGDLVGVARADRFRGQDVGVGHRMLRIEWGGGGVPVSWVSASWRRNIPRDRKSVV